MNIDNNTTESMKDETTQNDRRQRDSADSPTGGPGHAHTRTRGDGVDRGRRIEALDTAGRAMSFGAGTFALAVLGVGIVLGLGISLSTFGPAEGGLVTLAEASGEAVLVCAVLLGLGESLREVADGMGDETPNEVRA